MSKFKIIHVAIGHKFPPTYRDSIKGARAFAASHLINAAVGNLLPEYVVVYARVPSTLYVAWRIAETWQRCPECGTIITYPADHVPLCAQCIVTDVLRKKYST